MEITQQIFINITKRMKMAMMISLSNYTKYWYTTNTNK